MRWLTMSIYLSIRGEVERKLLTASLELDFTADEHLYTPAIKEKESRRL